MATIEKDKEGFTIYTQIKVVFEDKFVREAIKSSIELVMEEKGLELDGMLIFTISHKDEISVEAPMKILKEDS